MGVVSLDGGGYLDGGGVSRGPLVPHYMPILNMPWLTFIIFWPEWGGTPTIAGAGLGHLRVGRRGWWGRLATFRAAHAWRVARAGTAWAGHTLRYRVLYQTPVKNAHYVKCWKYCIVKESAAYGAAFH
jgi:hypothetical protein